MCVRACARPPRVCVALVMQNAKRMQRIVLSPVACLTLPYFCTYLIHGKIFENKIMEYKMCFDFIDPTTFV